MTPDEEATDQVTDGTDLALVLAVPGRHLASAAEGCRERGWTVLPAGGPGDLDRVPRGTRVLVIVSDDLERMPGATWSAVFTERIAHEAPEALPDGVPATWAAEHAGVPDDVVAEPPPTDPDDDHDDADAVGPQAFLRVTDLAPLPRERWVHANELVPKQGRGGRAFLPRTPRLVRIVD